MKRIFIALVVGMYVGAALFCWFAQPVKASGLVDTVLITEVQTGSTTSASDEFIELYNASTESIDVSSWRLEYFPATAANFDNPSRKIPLHGIIGGHRYFLAASLNYLTDKANETFSATLAKTGGHVRLVRQATEFSEVEVKDLIGWGGALHPQITASPAPAEGKSLTRKTDTSGVYANTQNNLADFAINDMPQPQADMVLTASPEEPSPANPSPDPIENPPTEATGLGESPTASPDPIVASPSIQLLPPQITELLPNPKAPASDDTDEYVELFNPNNDSLSLAGYKLQTGNSFSYSYTFSQELLPGQSYVAFMVTQTGDVLANGGGKTRLVDPQGNIVDSTVYEAADDGLAWAYINGSWQWTSIPTPNAANLLSGSGVAAKTATKKATSTKSKAAKTTTTKKPATKAATKTAKKANGSNQDKDEPGTTTIHWGILAGVTAVAVGYALYEYRDDIANRIHQLRRYRTNRRAVGEER